MSDIFISYAHQDGTEVGEWLYSRLKGAGYSVWKDNHSLKSGENFPNKIFSAIEKNHYFIILISKASKNSGFVQDEIGTAKAIGKTIIPIVIDDSKFPTNITATQALVLKNGIQDWENLHKLVNDLDGGEDIPRVVNMSKHDDYDVKGILVLKHLVAHHLDLKEPGEITKISQKLGAAAIPIIKKAKAGIVPHGHSAIASAVQAYLLGAINQMPDLYYPFRLPESKDNKFRIEASNVVHLQNLRDIGEKDCYKKNE